MKVLNYDKVLALKPFILEMIINQAGQTIEILEHPLKGDESTVLAVYHKERLIVETESWDCADFFEGSDYNPVYMHGEMKCAWEFDL